MQAEVLALVMTMALPGVEGRIDHLAADVTGNRLFVAALGNNTVEVLDLGTGRRVRTLSGFSEPQGMAWVPELKRLFVAEGGTGRCAIFEGDRLTPAGEAPFSGDADNVRYDAASRRIWVGFGDGALGQVDAATGRRLGEIRLAAHPESFQLERQGPRIFVNVPGAGHVAVVDRKRGAVVARWPVAPAAANFPMALDEAGGRLFVGCRNPPEVLVMETHAGRILARFRCPGDADDLFYDAARKRIYVTGGDGTLAVFDNQYRQVSSIVTAGGARTSLWVAAVNRLFVAVPHRGNQGAGVWVLKAE